ncbi:DUF4166 domain-containing protein [Montanilutibacter psychrotolerans]|nr:DUF4166 domain-containing protein [Lysobacter psychrotolerans]
MTTISEFPSAHPASTLYQRVLGNRYDELAPGLRCLHERDGRHVYRGKVDIVRGDGLLSRLCAWVTRLPPRGRGPIKVEIIAGDGREQWTRRVGTHSMRSRLWEHDGLLCERLGLVTFGFRMAVANDPEHGQFIDWRVARVRALGIPLPLSWFSGVHAREYLRDGRYRFDVGASLPIAGRLVHYKGWLDVE